MEEKNKEIKKKIESILFAAGKKIEAVEIAKLCRMSHNIPLIEHILNELKEKYNKDESPLFLNNEGTAWKLTVREQYIGVVQDIVKQSELSKTIMETLAIIAYKAPVMQSDIIKVRTNKAYDHLKALENSGYISREKKGRSKLIKLTPKFFEYFDIPPDKLKERFKNVRELEKVVEQKEGEVKALKTEAKDKKNEEKLSEDEYKKSVEDQKSRIDVDIREKEEKLPEIDLVDDEGEKEKLDTYDSEIAEGTDFEEPKSNIEIVSQKVGDLDVIDMGLPSEEKKALVEEAARLRREAESEEKKKSGAAAEAEKEKEFGRKFDLVGGGEEAPEEEAGEEAETEEEAPEGEEAEEQPEESEEQPEAGEEAETEEEAPEGEEAEEQPEEKEEEPEEEKEKRISATDIVSEAKEHAQTQPQKKREGKRLFEKGMSKDMQQKVDERVEEIVFGKKETKEEDEGKEEKEGETPERY